MKRQPVRKRVFLKSYNPLIEPLEDRFALSGEPWPTFAGNAQHTSLSTTASQPLETIHWQAPVDNFPTSRAAHYGGPLITAANTVIYPYKVGTTAAPDFHIIARNGNDGTLLWDETTDWVPTGYNWYPAHQPVYVPSLNRVYFSGANASLYYKDNVNTPSGVPTKVQINVFGNSGNVAITGLTADSAGNVYYGYRNGTVGGIVKVTPAGVATIVTANTASQDASVTDWIPQMNHTPALSADETILYTTLRRNGTSYYGRLVGLSTSTLATVHNSGVLKDPRSGGANNAGLLNDSTASPMIAPDNKVFLGVFGNPYNGSRGWMLQMSADLTTQYTPGGFGWDTTPSVVPASMVPQYSGGSSYLLFTKYNNYYGITNGGDGSNAIAVLDPNDTEVEYHADSGGQLVMKRVLYKVGPTPDWDYPTVPTAVREWCINFGAVDPATQSVITNCADGKFYRWHLPSDTLSEAIQLTSGIGQPYTMTVIGVDGTLYGIQIGTIFAIGKTPGISVSDATFAEGTGGTTTATFTVSLDFPRTQTITVNYATSDGTAAAGSDYTSASGTLTFNPGQKSQTFNVTIGTDALYELNESFAVTLSGATNAVLLDAIGQGTINNDDAQPTLSINDVTLNEGNSGTSSFIFTVALSSPSGLTTTVNFATSNDTANGADFQSTSGSLTFNPGQTSKTITVLVNGDGTFESNETFFVNLSGNVNAGINDGQGVGTISNDDGVPSLGITDASVGEGGSVLFTVTLSNASAQTVSVNYATANGTTPSSASAGMDYSAGSGTLTFNPGETTKSFSVATVNDAIDELHETFEVNLSGAVNAFVMDSQGIGTIIDNDPATSVSIGNASSLEGITGMTAFTFTLTLASPSGKIVTVYYTTADGTATIANNDYQSNSGFVRILAGQTSGTITVLVNGDSANEPNEDFFVNLTSATAAAIADGQGVGTIVNDDGLILTTSDASLSEGDSGTTAFTFAVTMSTVSGSTVTVDFATADGTATTTDGDFSGGTGTLTFAPGETSKTITILVNGDLVNESDETFFVNLSNPNGGTIGDGQGIGTIQNDDPLPSITIDDLSVPELDYNTGTINVYVFLSAPSGQTVTVFYETANGTASSTSANKDYIDTFGTLTFDPGETVASFEVSIVGDVRDEPHETIRVLLSSPVNATIADDLGIVTILDDDIVYVQTVGPTVTEGNSGQTTATVTVNLTIPADYDITIDFATADLTALAGIDYVATSGTLTFLSGITSQTVDIQISGDLVDELDEKLDFVLSNATPGVYYSAFRHTDVNITDDDTASFTINDVAMSEGNSGTTNAVFTVSLSTSADHIVGVNFATANGTAIANGDYLATSGTLTFIAGVTTQTISVVINGDVLGEPNETYFVNLSAPTGGATIGDPQGLGTITNDDSSLISINDVSQPELHNGVHGYTYVVTLSSPSTQTITVQFATADGTATTANNDYFNNSGTLTFNPGQTTKVITVQVKGDKRVELDEEFYVNLSNATNAAIADNQGLGTILNDDGPVNIVFDGARTGFSATRSANDEIHAPLGRQRSLVYAGAFPAQARVGSDPANVSSENRLTTEVSFADLRFYILNSGKLQSIAPSDSTSEFAYSIDSRVRPSFKD